MTWTVDHRCISCGHKCDPHIPDNITLVPVCVACWGQLSVVERSTVMAQFRQAEAMDAIASVFQRGVESIAMDIANGRRARRTGGDLN